MKPVSIIVTLDAKQQDNPMRSVFKKIMIGNKQQQTISNQKINQSCPSTKSKHVESLLLVAFKYFLAYCFTYHYMPVVTHIRGTFFPAFVVMNTK